MSKRSVWCEFDKETRKYIKKRDKEQCVICGKKGALQIMHIFMSRASGGKGCKENGCLGCVKCHNLIDNPIGNINYIKGQKMLQYCKNYLIEKEYINYDNEFLDSLKFKKDRIDFQVQVIDYARKQRKTCKDCVMLVKHNNNSSIPIYYCKYKKMRKNKNADICNKFKDAI